MGPYTLSRSSWLYKFVFGKEEGQIDGLPEPMSNCISLGLFVVLLIFMTFMKFIAYTMLTIMEVVLAVICFLVDGSYMRGGMLTSLKIIKIEPWPVIYGKRLPPWTVLTTLTLSYLFWYVGTAETLEFLVFVVFITLVFRSIKPGDKSPAMELAEKLDPVVDGKLSLAYHRKPVLFPTLYFVD